MIKKMESESNFFISFVRKLNINRGRKHFGWSWCRVLDCDADSELYITN